ncbi:MAG: hypothetical protein ABMB14_06395 [Myxococcota bacterium]
MYNLLLALGGGLVTFVAVTVWLGPVAGIVPALGVIGLVMFLLARRTGKQVEAEIATVGPLLQQRRIDEAETKLVHIKEKYGPWQFLLAGQIDAQLGMIDYLQRKFDDARPKLEAGKWRNAIALASLGCIDWRQGRKDDAWKQFAAAASASSTDATVYAVWATLLSRDGLRTEALEAVGKGLTAIPGNAMLKELQSRIANKKKIEPAQQFGETWYQYFPEDLAQQMVMRGTRPGGAANSAFGKLPQPPQPRFGARHAPRR